MPKFFVTYSREDCRKFYVDADTITEAEELADEAVERFIRTGCCHEVGPNVANDAGSFEAVDLDEQEALVLERGWL